MWIFCFLEERRMIINNVSDLLVGIVGKGQFIVMGIVESQHRRLSTMAR